jgi:hypothetical protein
MRLGLTRMPYSAQELQLKHAGMAELFRPVRGGGLFYWNYTVFI